jgi:peptidase E
MKLFLSSARKPNEDERRELFGDKAQPSVVIIPNAWDTYTDEEGDTALTNVVSSFQDQGYKVSMLDLVHDSKQQKQDALRSHDFVWVLGGNSFYLNYYIHYESFNTMLIEAIEQGLVYGGESAGAVAVAPTLHGIEYIDDPNDAPKVIWEGLGLIDFGIVPHWGLEKYAGKLERVASEMEHYVSDVVRLTNKQAIIQIDGGLEVRE